MFCFLFIDDMLRAPKSQHGGKVPTFEKPTKIVTKKEEDMRESE
jgi:hypothetical protein